MPLPDENRRYPIHASLTLPEARRLYEFALQNSAGPGGGDGGRTFLQIIHDLAAQVEAAVEGFARAEKRRRQAAQRSGG